jgi:hypothetical protein
MKKHEKLRSQLLVGLLSVGLSTMAFAESDSVPIEKEAHSKATKSVQEDVDKGVAVAAAAKRKALMSQAIGAVNDTKKALIQLDDKKPDDALETLAKVTGKLELIISRDPSLAFAPVDVDISTFDLLASPDTVQDTITLLKDLIDNGQLQQARPMMDMLASEIRYSTTTIPLATYPEAIKAISPLIDAGKFDEAKAGLQAALNTLVINETITPLPIVRASALLEKAEQLAVNQERSDDDEQELREALQSAKDQLKLAQLLGYGDKTVYKPMYEEIKKIEEKSADGKSGKGWFNSIKEKMSGLL